MSFVEKFRPYVQACAGCHRPTRSGVPYCSSCCFQVQAAGALRWVQLQEHFGAYYWWPYFNEQALFRQLIDVFKGHPPASFYRITDPFGAQLYRRLSLHDLRLLPLPSSSGRQHAWALAKDLGGQVGWPVSDVFGRPGRSQKYKSLFKRQQLKLQLREGLPKAGGYVLVDDMVTTGATMMAARRCLLDLGVDSRQIYATTLFYRPKGGSLNGF